MPNDEGKRLERQKRVRVAFQLLIALLACVAAAYGMGERKDVLHQTVVDEQQRGIDQLNLDLTSLQFALIEKEAAHTTTTQRLATRGEQLADAQALLEVTPDPVVVERIEYVDRLQVDTLWMSRPTFRPRLLVYDRLVCAPAAPQIVIDIDSHEWYKPQGSDFILLTASFLAGQATSFWFWEVRD